VSLKPFSANSAPAAKTMRSRVESWELLSGLWGELMANIRFKQQLATSILNKRFT
jgi:hypothetical protein